MQADTCPEIFTKWWFVCLFDFKEKCPSAVTAVSLGIRTHSCPTPSYVAGRSHWKLFCMDILFLIPVNQLFPSPSYLSSKGLSLSASKLRWDPAFVTSAKHVLDQKDLPFETSNSLNSLIQIHNRLFVLVIFFEQILLLLSTWVNLLRFKANISEISLNTQPILRQQCGLVEELFAILYENKKKQKTTICTSFL